MTERDEEAVVADMMTRITDRFPTVSPARIRGIIEEEHRRLNGGPIHDYVDVLVEKETVGRLRKEAVPVPLSGDPTE